MLFFHPAHYPLAIASGTMRMPWLRARPKRPKRPKPPAIPKGELYVHDILRIIDDHRMQELEQDYALSPKEDAPDAPAMLSEAQRHRLFRRLTVGVVVFIIASLYGSGVLHM